MRAKGRRLVVVDVLGAIAAIVAWLGWFQIAPALGFPTIGPAAMVNRVFVPHSNPGVWIGWTLLVIGLAIVVGLYEVLEARGMIPRGAVFGLLFGVAAWAVAGLVVPIIGTSPARHRRRRLPRAHPSFPRRTRCTPPS